MAKNRPTRVAHSRKVSLQPTPKYAGPGRGPTLLAKATLSDIFGLYERALKLTRGRLETRLVESTTELEKFYNEFLKRRIVRYDQAFDNPSVRREIHRLLEARFHTRTLRFWAVDGACRKIETSDLAIFYGGSYLVKGELALQDNPAIVTYRESEPDDDSSLVAYLPLSPEDLTVINPEDRFAIDDAERISISGLDTALMLLAEVFMCYRGASSDDHPHMILWDHSLSSVLANATPHVDELRLSGFKMGGEVIWYPDLLVAYSKPWNEELDIPSRKTYRVWERVVAKLYQSPNHTVTLDELAADIGLTKDKIQSQSALLWNRDRLGKEHPASKLPTDSLAAFDSATGRITLRAQYEYSPDRARRFFEHFCQKFFREKDPTVLLYKVEDDQGNLRERFLSTSELQFLMAIGLRLTFEACWKNNVLLVGVVKDSATSYYTNHFFGVMRHVDPANFGFTPRLIPPTDRLTFERLPHIDHTIEAPWGSEEFDAIFMTLRMRKEPGAGKATMQGMRGNILLAPNLIMRSLVQFYLRHGDGMDPSMGHAIFIDRLVSPDLQSPKVRVSHADPQTGGDPALGIIEPFIHDFTTTKVTEHEIVVYLLDVLTKNVFSEIIGYPDPLHYADRGAKSVLNMVQPMLQSSERLNRVNPIHKTVRQNRGG